MMLRLSFAFALLNLVNSVPVDNGVVGSPEISCDAVGISVSFNTRNGFEGKVYVKSQFLDGDCVVEGDGQRSVASIDIGLDQCGTRRVRSLNPKGVFVTTNLIVSFHPLFLTKVDRAYKIQCFYMEADKTVTADLLVSMLTTDFQTQLVPMPVCRYDLLDGSPTGSPVTFANVGQPIYHKWTCDTDTENTFCMIVRDCFVSDSNGEPVQLVDENGCAVDLFLLNNPEYTADLMAGVEAHVFKYADKEDLYFQCQITILVKEPGETCPQPSCPVPSGRGAGGANPQQGPPVNKPDHPFPLQSGSPYLPNGRAKRSAPLREAGEMDVAANLASLTIIDSQGPSRLDQSRAFLPIEHRSKDLCISPPVFFSAFLVVAAVLTVLSGLLARIYLSK